MPVSSCQLGGAKPTEISLVALGMALRKPDLKRRQYETIDEFELRAEKLLADARRLTGDGSFKFTVPVPPDQVAFDAARGVLTVSPSASSGLVPTTVGDGNRIIISRSIRTAGATNVETPFGGRHLAAKEEEVVLAVNVRGGDYLRWPKGFQPVTFQMVREAGRRSRAKPAAPTLAVLFTVRLRSPYIIEETTRQSPRPDFPHDVTTYTTTVQLDIECAALINKSNNVLLQSIALSP
jgi:hypothetical protein